MGEERWSAECAGLELGWDELVILARCSGGSVRSSFYW